MNRRTITTIAIGVLAALIIGLLWWWFFSGGAPTPNPATDTFGSGGDKSAAQSGSGQGGNSAGTPGQGQGQNGQTVGQGGLSGGTNGSGQPGSGTSGSGTPGSGIGPLPSLAGSGGISTTYRPPSSSSGANWLAGGGTLGSAGYGYNGSGLTVGGGPNSGTVGGSAYNPYGSTTIPGGSSGPSFGLNSGGGTFFTPAQINNLNNSQVYGNLSIVGSGNGSGNGGGNTNTGSIIGIAGTAVACAAFLAPGIGSAPTFPPALYVQNPQNNNKGFMDCLMRTIARAALQQITNSVVQWINSGFNGSPSFITNYQQFFASVADQAAGSFIQNYTNFAPFCTPFRNQIRTALAQSYARQGSSSLAGRSCTLSGLLGTNTQTLFSGNTNGWSNLLQFTTTPSNNPFGSYMSAQSSLQNALSSASQNASRNMTPSGFLNFQQPYQCASGAQTQAIGYSCPAGCKCKVTTPGSVIESSLAKTLNTSQDYLTQAGISGSFDAIINALVTQLMNKALYSGLSNLSAPDYSSGNTLTFDQQTAQAQGQYLLSQLQNLVTITQQYGQTEQGSIQDIQAAQQQLNTLANCWHSAASSTTDAAKQQVAQDNASSTLSTLHQYDLQVVSLNGNITRANAAIALLQDLQTRTLSVGSTAEVATVQHSFDSAQTQGRLFSANDLTQAQQDRTTLQSQLSTLNQATQAGLQQCYAFNQTTS